MVQLLGPDGTRTPHEQLDAVLEEAGLATPERLRGYYRDMVMIRAADLEATSLQRQRQNAAVLPRPQPKPRQRHQRRAGAANQRRRPQRAARR